MFHVGMWESGQVGTKNPRSKTGSHETDRLLKENHPDYLKNETNKSN
jgi:hypothetical protein